MREDERGQVREEEGERGWERGNELAKVHERVRGNERERGHEREREPERVTFFLLVL